MQNKKILNEKARAFTILSTLALIHISDSLCDGVSDKGADISIFT